ncbi:MAG: hypothetical protein B7Y45_02880 [Sphingomonas sp. 28-66-16]|nr:MAG: hypothetical protein B7Y45_02880 [Sphingomonas sp. 28-66-16]
MSTDNPHSLIDRFTVAASWNGSPSVLLTSQNTVMPQTPNGTTIFAATNQSTLNNQGQISLTSGGGAPSLLDVPALTSQPTILIKNWEANNLSVTNISASNSTPVLVQAVGPGIPGITPQSLVIGTALPLAMGQCAQTNASPQYMQLVMQVTGPTLGIIGFIGGPADANGNNGYVVAVNATANTGPGTGMPAPAGYYATTTSNTYAYQFNWGSSLVFVSNLSPSTAQSVSILLRAL